MNSVMVGLYLFKN